MKTEESDVFQEPRSQKLVKLLPMFFVLVLQLGYASAAFSVTDDLFKPMWDGISGIVGQIVVIVIVVIGFGKASTIDGIPTWIKAIIGFICFVLCVAIATSISTWGVGGKVQDLVGNIKFW